MIVNYIHTKMPIISLDDARNGAFWKDTKNRLTEFKVGDYNQKVIDELNSYSLWLHIPENPINLRKLGHYSVLWSSTYKSLECFVKGDNYTLLKPVIPSHQGYEIYINQSIKLLATLEHTIERHMLDRNPDITIVLKTKKDILKTLRIQTLPEFLLFDIWYLMIEHKYVNVMDFIQYTQNMNYLGVMYFINMFCDNRTCELFPEKFIKSFSNIVEDFYNGNIDKNILRRKIYYTRCVYNWINTLKKFSGNRFNCEYITQLENILKIIENDHMKHNIQHNAKCNKTQTLLNNDFLNGISISSGLENHSKGLDIDLFYDTTETYYGVVNEKGELFGLFPKEQIHKIIIIVSKLVMTDMVSMYVIDHTIKVINKYINHVTNYVRITAKYIFNHFEILHKEKNGATRLFCSVCCECFVWHSDIDVETNLLNRLDSTITSSSPMKKWIMNLK